MTHRTRTSFVIGLGLALPLVLAAGSTVQARHAASASGMQMTETKMKDHCKDMMEHKKQMAADTKQKDAELTELVAKMNRASGEKQMPLMAAAITQIVEQKVAMDQHKAKMEEEMMSHMMQHMQMGKDSMAHCPMMKDMHDMKGMAPMPGMKSPNDKSAGTR